MLSLSSPAFRDGHIEKRFGNLGPKENMEYDIPQTSFPLAWKGAPADTKSYAIVFIDYDDTKDEGFPFIHWLACDIPANVNVFRQFRLCNPARCELQRRAYR